MKEVKIFDLSFDEEFRRSFHEGAEQIFDEAYLSDHTFCRKFEKAFAEFCGISHSLSVSNGTAAIELALRSLNVKGKKVILPTNTFIATSVAILNAGAIPLPLDIENDYFGLSPSELEKNLSSEIGAVVVVHIGGHISPHLRRIKKLCEQYNVPLVEDAAHAHGASLDGKKAGAWGAFGAFSHFTTKIMTTGEGGSLVCNNETLYEQAFSVRRFGLNPEQTISHLREGSNFKMGEFQALLGLLELNRIQERIDKRRTLAKRYQENLKGSSWRFLSDKDGTLGTYYKQVVLSPLPRKEVEHEFLKNKIALTGGVFFIPIHRQPVYQGLYLESHFPNANLFADIHLCPPCYPELRLDDVDRVCELFLKLKK